MSTLTLTDAQLETMSHSLIDTLNEYERLPFGELPAEKVLRETLISKLEILSWSLSPEPDPAEDE